MIDAVLIAIKNVGSKQNCTVGTPDRGHSRSQHFGFDFMNNIWQ